MFKNMQRKFIAIILAMVGMMALVPYVTSADMPVPADLQAAIFKKVFEYVKAFATPDEVTVLIVGDSGSSAQDVVKSFSSAGITAKIVPSANLAKSLTSKTVVYVLGEVDVVGGICEKSGNLSITGVPSMVDAGAVSVGLNVEAGKPKIVVHKGRLGKEKQELSAKLLQLARVIG